MGKFFHYVAESILLGEDKLSDFAKKNQVGEEFEQKIRRVCQKIGPRGLSKYGVWLAQFGAEYSMEDISAAEDDELYQTMEKYDRISSSPTFIGKKDIDQYESFLQLKNDVELYKTQKEIMDIAMAPDPDAPILFDNEKYVVRLIKTRDAAIKFGLGSGRAKGEAQSRREEGAVHGKAWCITGRNNSYFETYTAEEAAEEDIQTPDWKDEGEDETIVMKPIGDDRYVDYLWDGLYVDRTWPHLEGTSKNPCYYILSKTDWMFDKFCIIPTGFRGGKFRVANRFQNNLNITVTEDQLKNAIGEDLYEKIYRHWKKWLEQHPTDEYETEGDPPTSQDYVRERLSYYEYRGDWTSTSIRVNQGRVDVVGDVDFTQLGWKSRSMVKFRTVEGYFDCSKTQFSEQDDLSWLPIRVSGDFICTRSNIDDFTKLPMLYVGGDFIMNDFQGDRQNAVGILKEFVQGEIVLDKDIVPGLETTENKQ